MEVALNAFENYFHTSFNVIIALENNEENNNRMILRQLLEKIKPDDRLILIGHNDKNLDDWLLAVGAELFTEDYLLNDKEVWNFILHKEIYFQQHKICLGDIISEENQVTEILFQECPQNLLRKIIDNPPACPPELENKLFVDNTFHQIENKIVLPISPRTLAAPTIDMNSIPNDTIIVIDIEEKMHNQQNENWIICNSCQEGKNKFNDHVLGNVHLLKCESVGDVMEIKWKQTKGTVENLLLPNVLKTDVAIPPTTMEELVEEDENKVCIISGPSGIGKSTINTKA